VNTTHATAGASVTDPGRTAAIHAVRHSIDEHLEWIAGDVDDHLTGRHPTALRDARDKLVLLADRLDALEQLGRPTREAELHPELLA
jgi:hypothetical protein